MGVHLVRLESRFAQTALWMAGPKAQEAMRWI